MARAEWTQGAGSRVPISGSLVPGLTGQGTCRHSLSTGADKSEPHGTSRHASARAMAVQCGTGGRVVWGGARVAGGARVSWEGAHLPGLDECIYGGCYRAGWGRAGARTVPEQCGNRSGTVPE